MYSICRHLAEKNIYSYWSRNIFLMYTYIGELRVILKDVFVCLIFDFIISPDICYLQCTCCLYSSVCTAGDFVKHLSLSLFLSIGRRRRLPSHHERELSFLLCIRLQLSLCTQALNCLVLV